MRILYIEDDPNDAELARRAFRSQQPESRFDIAESIEKAIEIIEKHPIDYYELFLSDYELPDGEALEFIRTLRLRGFPQPVVIITGNDDPQVAARVLDEGAVAFFVKSKQNFRTLPEKLEGFRKIPQTKEQNPISIRVLYLENNPIDAELTQHHFKSNAPHVHLKVITTADELIKICKLPEKNPDFDAILIDNNIPGTGGTQILTELKEKCRIYQPIILLLDRSDDDLSVQALKLGADNLVVKNIGYFQLLPPIIEVAITKARLIRDQKASLERERLFRLMTENSRDITFRVNLLPKISFQYLSPSVKNWTGFTPEELTSDFHLAEKRIHPDDVQKFHESFLRPDETSPNLIFRFLTKSQKYIWLESSSRVIHNSKNQPITIEGILRDVTERMNFENELQVENQRREELETIINKSPNLVIRWKPQIGKPLEYISDNISRFGYKAKDFLSGKILYEDIVHPDDIKRMHGEVRQHARMNDVQYLMRYRLVTKKGETRWVDDLTWVVTDGDGKPLYHQGVVTDITDQISAEQALQKTEEQYKQLVEQVPVATYIDTASQPSSNLYSSPQIEKITGYSLKEWHDKPTLWHQIIYPEDLSKIEEEDKRINATGEPFNLEYRIIHKDGHIVWVEDQSSLLRGIGGEPDRYQGVMIDITDRKNREEEQKIVQQRSRDLSQAIIQLSLDPAITSGDFEKAIKHITEQGAEMLKVERVSIWMFAEGEESIRCNDLYERTSKRHSSNLILLARDYPTYFESLRAGRVIEADDARTDPRSREFTENYLTPLGISSLLDCAIRVQGKLVGMVSFEHVGEKRHWHPNEVNFGGEIADQVSLVILNLERINAENALRSNELKFRTIIEQFVEGFILIDEDGYIVDWNQSMDRLYEMDRKSVIGNHFWDILFQVVVPERRTEEHYEIIKKSIQDALKYKNSPLFNKSIEAEIMNRQGIRLVIQQTIFPILIGGRFYIASYTRDISQEKKKEKEIEERAINFRSLFEQAYDAILLLEDGCFVDCNKRSEQIYGCEREQILGKHPYDFSPILQPDGKDSRHQSEKFIKAALEGVPQLFEWLHIRKNGTPFAADISLTKVEIGGKPLLQAMVRDISERKQAENIIRESETRFRSIFEQAQDAIFILNNNNLMDCNHQTEVLFGWSRKELLGKTPPELSPEMQPDGLISTQLGMEKYHLALQGHPQVFDWVHKRKNGTQFYSEVNLSRIEYGGKALVQAFVRDTTQRKFAEESLRTTEERYRGLFEDSPISLWEEDFSGVKQYLDNLKKKGVKDFDKYFAKHPEIIIECAKRVRILDVNKATVKLYCARNKQDLLKKLDLVFSEESYEGVVEEIEQIAAGKNEFEWEGINQTLKNEKIFIRLHWSVAPGYEDTLGRVILSVTDITKEKASDKAIRLSEARYRSLVENQTEVIARYDLDDRLIFANEAFCKVFGIDLKKMIGQKMPIHVSQGDLTLAKRTMEGARKPPYRTQGENINLTVQGPRWFKWDNSAILDGQGRIIEIQSVGWDITDLKETENALKLSEERYRLIAENMDDIIWLMELDLSFLYVSPSVKRTSGYSPEEFLGLHLQQLMPSESYEVVSKRITELMTMEQLSDPKHNPVLNFELKLTKKNGSSYWAEITASLVRNENGEAAMVMGTARDISERKMTELALKRRDSVLEAVSVTTNKLLESHDWRANAPEILRILGTAAEVDRVYIIRYPKSWSTFPIDNLSEVIIEWTSPGVLRHMQNPNLQELLTMRPLLEKWGNKLKKGKMLVGALKEFPPQERKIVELLGSKSIAIFPIIIERKIDGLIGFEIVNKERPWDPAELDAFKTLADVFTSAIQRQNAYQQLIDRETRLNSILDASKDAIHVTKGEDPVYANDAFRKLFGLSRTDKIEDFGIRTFISSKDQKRYQEIANNRIEGKPAPNHYELKAIKNNGKEFDLEVHVSNYELMGETYTLALLRDISDKKQHDRELEVISGVSTALRKALTKTDMLPIILNELSKTLDAEGGVITQEDPVSGDMVVEYATGEVSDSIGFRIPKGKSISGHVQKTKKPYIAHNVLDDPLFVGKKFIKKIREIACYPLMAQKQVIGTIWIGRVQPFNKMELRVIGSIAEMAGNAILRSEFHEQTRAHLEKMIALQEIDNAISSTKELNEILREILESTRRYLKVDAADVLLYDGSSDRLKCVYDIGYRIRNMADFSVKMGEGWAGKAAQSRTPVFIPDLLQVKHEALNKPPVTEKLVSYYAIPLITRDEVKGVLECFTRYPLHPDEDWMEFVSLLAGQAAIAIESAQLFENLKKSNVQLTHAYDDTIEGWSRALDIRDKETEGHTKRVVDLTLRLARLMGIPEDQIPHIKRGALLHDIGKLSVPDTILFKPSALTAVEWKIMVKHPQHAYNMLSSIEYLKPALDIPYSHHEHWDGSGYPRGLKGDGIPLAARVFAVVDIWDALLSDRPYRPAWSREKTIAHIKNLAGTQLDPRIVAEFIKIISENDQ